MKHLLFIKSRLRILRNYYLGIVGISILLFWVAIRYHLLPTIVLAVGSGTAFWCFFAVGATLMLWNIAADIDMNTIHKHESSLLRSVCSDQQFISNATQWHPAIPGMTTRQQHRKYWLTRVRRIVRRKIGSTALFFPLLWDKTCQLASDQLLRSDQHHTDNLLKNVERSHGTTHSNFLIRATPDSRDTEKQQIFHQ